MSLFKLKKFFLLTIFLAPSYLIKMKVLNFPTNAFEILLALNILFLTLSLVLRWKTNSFSLVFFDYKKSLPPRFIHFPRKLSASIILIFCSLLISIFSNDNFVAGLGILKGWFVLPILFSIGLYLTIDSESDIENVFEAIFLSAAAIGAIACLYKFFGVVTYDNRLASFYLSPNHLAMYLAPGIIFGCFFLMNYFSEKKHARFAIVFLLSVIMLIALYFTYSYATWLAVLFSVLLTFLISKQSKKNVSLFSLVLFLIFSFLLISQSRTQKFSDLIAVSERSSISSRMMIWHVSIELIKKHPLVGIGPGNFQNAYLSMQPYFPPYLEWAVPQPHNIFLAFWLQTGILGLLGFLLLLFFIFKTLLVLIKNNKSATLAAPLFAFFLYTVLHGLVDTTYWKNDLAFLFWICLFLTLSLKNIEETDIKHQQPPQ